VGGGLGTLGTVGFVTSSDLYLTGPEERSKALTLHLEEESSRNAFSSFPAGVTDAATTWSKRGGELLLSRPKLLLTEGTGLQPKSDRERTLCVSTVRHDIGRSRTGVFSPQLGR